MVLKYIKHVTLLIKQEVVLVESNIVDDDLFIFGIKDVNQKRVNVGITKRVASMRNIK